MSNGLFEQAGENIIFVLQFALIIVVMFVVAYVVELAYRKKHKETGRILSTKKIAAIGLFSALSAILYTFFRFPLPFIAPAFYEMDFADLPALIGAFAFGPVAGVLIVFVRCLLKLMIQGTQTAFVGELASFVIGASFILPAAIVYRHKKSKKMALIGCVVGTVFVTVFATFFNAIYLIPTFAQMFFGGDINSIIEMGNAIYGAINSVWTLAVLCVAPFNLLKAAVVSVLTMLVYKKLSPIMKG